MVVMISVRHLDRILLAHVQELREAVVLLGARQVGKTTILRKLFPGAYYITADNEHVRAILDRYDISAYRELIVPTERYLVIDEIHLLKDPGRAAKIIYDQIPSIRLFLTGSSSFWIKNRATESMAGRKIDYHLFPLTISEYLVQTGSMTDLFYPVLRHIDTGPNFPDERIYPFDMEAITNNLMRYGSYPALIEHPQKEAYLKNLVDSVVFRDLLELSLIDNRIAARNLLRLLAYQIGSLVNVNELAGRLHIDAKTVRRYINLFEQSFIIFSLSPYMKAGRKEIGKMQKIYFYDCGLRNALIENFQPMDRRADTGQLFENLVISEVYKGNSYGSFGYALHFWRTTDGSEVDLVLTKGDSLIGFEIKTSVKHTNRAFLTRYPQAKLFVVTMNNFL